jgi:hypothetical protein
MQIRMAHNLRGAKPDEVAPEVIFYHDNEDR